MVKSCIYVIVGVHGKSIDLSPTPTLHAIDDWGDQIMALSGPTWLNRELSTREYDSAVDHHVRKRPYFDRRRRAPRRWRTSETAGDRLVRVGGPPRDLKRGCRSGCVRQRYPRTGLMNYIQVFFNAIKENK